MLSSYFEYELSHNSLLLPTIESAGILVEWNLPRAWSASTMLALSRPAASVVAVFVVLRQARELLLPPQNKPQAEGTC